MLCDRFGNIIRKFTASVVLILFEKSAFIVLIFLLAGERAYVTKMLQKASGRKKVDIKGRRAKKVFFRSCDDVGGCKVCVFDPKTAYEKGLFSYRRAEKFIMIALKG